MDGFFQHPASPRPCWVCRFGGVTVIGGGRDSYRGGGVTVKQGGSACRLGPGDVVLARRELGYRPAQRDQLRQRLTHPLAALAHGRTAGL